MATGLANRDAGCKDVPNFSLDRRRHVPTLPSPPSSRASSSEGERPARPLLRTPSPAPARPLLMTPPGSPRQIGGSRAPEASAGAGGDQVATPLDPKKSFFRLSKGSPEGEETETHDLEMETHDFEECWNQVEVLENTSASAVRVLEALENNSTMVFKAVETDSHRTLPMSSSSVTNEGAALGSVGEDRSRTSSMAVTPKEMERIDKLVQRVEALEGTQAVALALETESHRTLPLSGVSVTNEGAALGSVGEDRSRTSSKAMTPKEMGSIDKLVQRVEALEGTQTFAPALETDLHRTLLISGSSVTNEGAAVGSVGSDPSRRSSKAASREALEGTQTVALALETDLHLTLPMSGSPVTNEGAAVGSVGSDPSRRSSKVASGEGVAPPAEAGGCLRQLGEFLFGLCGR